MNKSRKIQLALGTILLWSSTAVSSFAATNINPEKVQSYTVKISGESIPSRQLNLTPDTNLIAQSDADIARMIYNVALSRDGNGYIPIWENALNQPDAKKIILEFCPSQPQDKVDACWELIKFWSSAKMMGLLDSKNYDLLLKINDIQNGIIDAGR